MLGGLQSEARSRKAKLEALVDRRAAPFNNRFCYFPARTVLNPKLKKPSQCSCLSGLQCRFMPGSRRIIRRTGRPQRRAHANTVLTAHEHFSTTSTRCLCQGFSLCSFPPSHEASNLLRKASGIFCSWHAAFRSSAC